MSYRIQPGQKRRAAYMEPSQVFPCLQKNLGSDIFGGLLIFHAKINKTVDSLQIGVVQRTERLRITSFCLTYELGLVCQRHSGFFDSSQIHHASPHITTLLSDCYM